MRTLRASSLVDSGQTGNNGKGTIPFVKRNDSIKILGDSLAESLGTLSVITRRIYFFPVQFQTQVKISNLRINVTKTSSNSLCSIGIYTNKKHHQVMTHPVIY